MISTAYRFILPHPNASSPPETSGCWAAPLPRAASLCQVAVKKMALTGRKKGLDYKGFAVDAIVGDIKC